MNRRVLVGVGAALAAALLVALVATRARHAHVAPRADGGAPMVEGHVLDRLGRPIGGAHVTAGGASGVSDERGHFTLRVPPGPFELRAEADGFLPEVLRDLTAQGGLELVLARKLALEGVVRARGRAVADATVTVAGPGGIHSGKSGPDGAFSFAGLAEGRYALRALKDNLAAYVPVIDVAGGDGGSGLVAVELQPGFAVSGRLRARDGRPIAGGEVTIVEAEGGVLPRSFTSVDEGRFVFEGVLPGEYLMTARAEGFYPSEPHPVRVQKGAVTLELRLDPGATIEGRVLDERAQPVAGARVEVSGEAPDGTPIAVTALGAPASTSSRLEAAGELGILRGPIPYPPPAPLPATAVTAPGPPKLFVTDERGAFRLSGLPAGRLVVAATHPDFARGSSQPLRVAAGSTVSVDVILSRGVAVRGRVTDDRGQPLAGVELAGDDGATMTVSDGRGEFELPHVARALVLTARSSGYVPQKRAVSPSQAGAIEIQLARAEGRLAGDVVDDRGAPVARARIEVAAPNMPARSANSDEGGRFSIAGLGPGPYRVTVTHPDFAPATIADVAPGDGARVQLSPGGGIDGDVRDARSGAVPPGTRVTLGAAGSTRTLTLVQGRFSATSLPAGTATLAATAPGYVAWSRAIEVPAGERLREVTVRDVRIELERAGQVSGRLRDDRGDPVADARVTVGGGATLTARTDRDGNFRVDGVAPGRVRVAADKDGASASEDVDVRAGDETRLDLRLRQP